MNEVIKVIVNEIPYGCEMCRWMTYDGYCDLSEVALPEETDTRPDWCPLVAGEIIPTLQKGCYLLIEKPMNAYTVWVERSKNE